jgi:hypothetical protein
MRVPGQKFREIVGTSRSPGASEGQFTSTVIAAVIPKGRSP